MEFITGEALITGYILTKVPVYLTAYLNNIIGEAATEADKEYNGFDDGGEENGGQTENTPHNSNDADDNNANIDNGQGGKSDNENVDINDGQNNENDTEKLNGPDGNVPDKDKGDDEIIDNNDDDGIMQGVTSFDDTLDGAVTGAGGIVVEQITDAPGGIDYDGAANIPGEELQLKPKFFDENMFGTAAGDQNSQIRRNKLRMRSQNKWHNNVKKPEGLRATRTKKPVRHLTENEISKNKK